MASSAAKKTARMAAMAINWARPTLRIIRNLRPRKAAGRRGFHPVRNWRGPAPLSPHGQPGGLRGGAALRADTGRGARPRLRRAPPAGPVHLPPEPLADPVPALRRLSPARPDSSPRTDPGPVRGTAGDSGGGAALAGRGG